MNRQFRPRVEALDDRSLMNAATVSAVMIPAMPRDAAPIASVTDLLGDPFNTNHGPYFEFRSQRLVRPGGTPATDTPTGGIWKTTDGGVNWLLMSAGDQAAGNASGRVTAVVVDPSDPTTALSHELGHVLGFRHEHTRP